MTPTRNFEWEVNKEKAKALIAAGGCAAIKFWSNTDAIRLCPKGHEKELNFQTLEGTVYISEWEESALLAIELIKRGLELIKKKERPAKSTKVEPAAETKKRTGIDLIAAERREQIEKHGRTLESDRRINSEGQLCWAAALLMRTDDEESPIELISNIKLPDWNQNILKRMDAKPYRERLIIAGALLAAELDRIGGVKTIEDYHAPTRIEQLKDFWDKGYVRGCEEAETKYHGHHGDPGAPNFNEYLLSKGMPSPPSLQPTETENHNINMVQTEKVCLIHHRRYFGQCPLCPSPIVTVTSNTFSGPMEISFPSPPPIQQEAIPEDRISLILKLSEWLNKELVWQVNHVKNSPREFHKGALSAFESVAAKILELTAVQPSAPPVKTEREDAKMLKELLHALVSVYQGLCYRLPDQDRHKFLKLPSYVKASNLVFDETEEISQPSPIVQEGESEDLKDWIDNHAECDSDEDATLWINGAKAMYRKLADDNAFCDSQIADYSKQLAEEIQSLQSQLSAIKKERDDYRKALENARLDLRCRRIEVAIGLIDRVLDKYPIPQTPTNE